MKAVQVSPRTVTAGRALFLHAPSIRRLPDGFAAVLVLVTLMGVWINASQYNFIPCSANCGETFDALQYVANYHLYGFKYGLVQDMAIAPDLSAHPFFYTHNFNLAGVLFTLSDAVGLTTVWSKQVLTLIGFGAGLLYVYRTTKLFTESSAVAIGMLILFSTDTEYVLSFGLNALRAWHWLAFFGVLLHAYRLARDPLRARWSDKLALLGLGVLAFGLGYDVWITCLLMCAFVLLYCLPRPILRGATVGLAAWVGSAFVLPIALRQVQIALVLGPEFWARDLYYSVVIKASVLSAWLPLPSLTDIDAFYQAAGVLRPPASPSNSLLQILDTARSMVVFQTLPTVGLISLLLVVPVAIVSVVVATTVALLPRRRVIGLMRSRGRRRSLRRAVVGGCRLMAAMTLGMLIGLFIFAPVSLHIYLKHEFPLIVAPLWLAKALLVGIAVSLTTKWWRSRRLLGVVPVVAVCLLALDQIAVQLSDTRARTPMDVSWIDAIAARSEATFAVSWIPSSVAVFTHNWVVGVQPGDEAKVGERLRAGKPPFQFSDYFLFGERDAAEKASTYVRPDFWLYYPTDPTPQFDNPAPTCRYDYLVSLVYALYPVQPEIHMPSVAATTVAAGADVLVSGHLEAVGESTTRVQLLWDGAPSGTAVYNCLYQNYQGVLHVPPSSTPGPHIAAARADYSGGPSYMLGEVSVAVDGTMTPSKVNPIRSSQPTADELAASIADVPVAARGAHFVIFDLRQSYVGHP